MTVATAAVIVSPSLMAQAPARDGARGAATGTAAIDGVVSTDTQPSRPLRRALVSLVFADNAPENPVRRTAVTDDAGKFQFAGLPAGRYLVAASRPGWVGMSYGAKRSGRSGTRVAIDEGQVATIATGLPRTAVITGVVLDSTGQPAISAGAATVDATGRFTISGVSPGRYRVTATFTSARAWTYRSAVVGGADVVDGPFEVRGHVNDLVVTFTDRPAQLDGKVLTAADAPLRDAYVIMFPTDTTAWYSQSRRIRSFSPSTDGSYSFKNLLPGDYLLAGIDDVEPGEWFDPAFLQRLMPGATKVSIAEGESKVQDVRVGGG